MNLEEIESEPDHGFYAHDWLVCEIKRMPRLLHLCGYVIIPYGHPYCGKSEINCLDQIDIHGGITYSDWNDFNEWKVGFDCAHSTDIVPGTMISHNFMVEYTYGDVSYKNWEYVENEIKKIAKAILINTPGEYQKEFRKTIDVRLAKYLLTL